MSHFSNSKLKAENAKRSLAALVLAGGQSSRMGADKAVMLWEGKPMLQRVCEVARECCQTVYILTPWPERYEEIIAENYQWLPESQPGQGPLVALAEGFRQISTEWVLLLACDLPQLKINILKQWASQLSTVPSNILAVVPRQGERWEPLCGFYRRHACTVDEKNGETHRQEIPPLQQFIQEGGRSFQTWLATIPVYPLYVGSLEAKMLKNCNYPEDLLKTD